MIMYILKLSSTSRTDDFLGGLPARCYLSFKHFFFPVLGWCFVYCQSLAPWALFVFEPMWLILLITFYISFSTVLLIFLLVDSISRSALEEPFIYYAPPAEKQKEKLNNELKSSASFQETFSVTFSNGRARTQDADVVSGCRLIWNHNLQSEFLQTAEQQMKVF